MLGRKWLSSNSLTAIARRTVDGVPQVGIVALMFPCFHPRGNGFSARPEAKSEYPHWGDVFVHANVRGEESWRRLRWQVSGCEINDDHTRELSAKEAWV